MIKKLSSLANCTKSRYLVKVNVRDGGKIRSKKQIYHGPKWGAEELEVALKKELKKRVGLKSEFATCGDVFDYYRDKHLVYQKSYYRCLCYVRRLKTDLGDVRLNKFNLELFRDYLRQDVQGDRKRTLKDSTLNRILAFAKAAFQFAAEDRKIVDNPLRYTRKLKRKEYSRDRTLTDDEWLKLKSFLPDYLVPIVSYAYLVPTRVGELKALKREWIKGRKVWLPGEMTKTGEPRYLPIPPVMKDYFDSIPEASEYVFYYQKEGTYLPIQNIRTDKGSFASAMKMAGISDFTFHDLRHTAATNLRRKGIRIELIMAIGGWKTVPTFLRYSNYSDDELVAAYL